MSDLATKYSQHMSCIYDETFPAEKLGRGTHYSIMRLAVESEMPAKFRDIAVIWDEDHDLRIITAIERLQRRDLLSHVLFIGERKGAMTVLVDDVFFFGKNRYQLGRYLDKIALEVANIGGDNWQAVLGCFSPSGVNERTNHEWIIHDDDHLVQSYLRAIGVRWQLGAKLAEPSAQPDIPWRERMS